MGVIDILLAGAVLGSTALCILLFLLPSQYRGESARARPQTASPHSRRASTDNVPPHDAETKVFKTSVQIVVLGDIGRSPRMQYHAMSAGKHGARVDLIGYKESDPHPDLLADPNISIMPIPPSPAALRTENRWMFMVCAPLKVLWQVWHLWHILGYRSRPARWLLVQNPPSIPTLAVAHALCFLRNTCLIIDWHNFGWTILALKLGQSHPLVSFARRYERYFGRLATANFCVTRVMAQTLRDGYHVPSPTLTLHDRPAAHFQPLTREVRDDFLKRCSVTKDHAAAIDSRETRLVVSSTSWTADEDFSLLLDALVLYSAADRHLPRLLVVITGKGPQKGYYLDLITRLNVEGKLKRAIVVTTWLSISDYASLLGSADLGVSLHVSSSGLDLPMKVVDMLGAALPVVGWNRFRAWSELVTEGVNGRGFGDVGQLAEILEELFQQPEGATELSRLKRGALTEGQKRWDDVWYPVAGRLLGVCD